MGREEKQDIKTSGLHLLFPKAVLLSVMSVSSWFAGIVKSDSVLWLENGPSTNCIQNIFSVLEIHVIL